MKTCAVVNVIESSIARDSKFVLPIHCGTEIGVASTKAFLGQILILYILALKLGILKGDLEKKELSEKLIRRARNEKKTKGRVKKFKVGGSKTRKLIKPKLKNNYYGRY